MTALFVGNASADNRKLTLKSEAPVFTYQGQQVPSVVALPYAQQKKQAVSAVSGPRKAVVRKDIILEEDFSRLTSGSVDAPDTDTELCTFYGQPGDEYIADGLLNTDGYTGMRMCPAGGTIYFWAYGGQSSAVLNTPLGDYSGHVTVTFRVKSDPTYASGASLVVNMVKGGIDNPTMTESRENPPYNYLTIFPNDGWQEVTVLFDNYSADNDGYIQFNCYGRCFMDDLKVVIENDFMAAPHSLGITAATDSTFTLTWEKVRRANSYKANLYKKVAVGTENASYNTDFEDGQMPAEYTISDGKVVDGVGKGESKALVLENSGYIYSPINFSKYKTFKVDLRVVAPEGVSPYEMGNINMLTYDGSKWTSNGTFSAGYFMDDIYTVDLEEELAWYGGFAEKYFGVGFKLVNCPEGTQLIVDNIECTTGIPSKLEQCYQGWTVTTNPLNYANYTDPVTGLKPVITDFAEGNLCHVTFGNLDPEGEYYYELFSRYLMLDSETQMLEAFYVATPQALSATDIDERGAFTANWKTTPKATRYLVSNYGTYIAKTDEAKHVVMNETFSRVNSDVTSATDPFQAEGSGNYTPTSLDDFADNAGWVAVGPAFCEGMIGCEPVRYAYNSMTTPALYLSNNSQFTLYIKAYGSVGDALALEVSGVAVGSIAFAPMTGDEGETRGIIDAEFVISGKPEYINNETTIKFSTSGYGAFMLDEVRVCQDLKAGQSTMTLLQQAEVGAEATSYDFTGLDEFDYNTFAYTVVAYYDREDGKTAVSLPSEAINVALVDEMAGINMPDVMESTENGNRAVVSIYGADGRQMSHMQKGLNILKRSNGQTVKVVR